MNYKLLLSIFFIFNFSICDQLKAQQIPTNNSDLLLPENRIIEPTSPILGYQLSEFIRLSNKHPEDLYHEVREKITNDQIYKNVIAYFSSLQPGLAQYCGGEYKNIVSNESLFPVVMKAAIPGEVLIPLFDTYNRVLLSLTNKTPEELKTQSFEVASNFKNDRMVCPPALKLINLGNKAKKYFPKHFDKLIELNNIVSAPEAAFPRIQFSINGFTRYVFDELLKIEINELKNSLKIIFETEANWVKQDKKFKEASPFFEYVKEESRIKKLNPLQVWLILAYSTRNMPSLDVEYAVDPSKALLLETYFWKFRFIRDQISILTKEKSTLNNVYPGNFKRDPGIYHFTTAGLLSCATSFEGFSKFESAFMGFFSKLGYKTDKFLGAFDNKEFKKGKLKYINNLMYQQAFGVGVKAGWVAGKFAAKQCHKFYAKNKNKDGKKQTDIENDDDIDQIDGPNE